MAGEVTHLAFGIQHARPFLSFRTVAKQLHDKVTLPPLKAAQGSRLRLYTSDNFDAAEALFDEATKFRISFPASHIFEMCRMTPWVT
jgi:hypothetical protein